MYQNLMTDFSFLCTFSFPGAKRPQIELSFRGTFAAVELSFIGNERSKNVPRTPWNIRSRGTFAPQERMFQELSFPGTFRTNRLSQELLLQASKNNLKL